MTLFCRLLVPGLIASAAYLCAEESSASAPSAPAEPSVIVSPSDASNAPTTPTSAPISNVPPSVETAATAPDSVPVTSQPAPDAHGTPAQVTEITLEEPAAAPATIAAQKSRLAQTTGQDEETASLLRVAEAKTASRDYESAAIAFHQLFTCKLTATQKRTVLIDYAHMLRQKGDLTKAAAVLEKVIKEYPLESDAPELFLDLGRIQRALGAYRTAISRFYSVINSTLKLPEDGASRYRQLAKTAQFEIAETHFQAGNYEEASRFYSRLRLLDLATIDRARAHFKSAYAIYLANDYTKAITSLRGFLDQYPDDENVPEARYLLALSFRQSQRPQDALNEALILLRTEKVRTAKDPRRWTYWQRKTGNQIANEFYEQGDASSALAIYTTLAELAPELVWRLPVLYQIGLCHERMGEADQALANYQAILDSLRNSPHENTAPAELADLQRMASWRCEQIAWQKNSAQIFNLLLPSHPSTAQTPPPPPHDASGSTAPAPATLR